MASRVAGPGTFTASVIQVADDNNMPGGWIGYAQITSDSSSFSTTLTDISGLSQAVTVNTNRRIQIIADLSLSLDSNDAVDVYIREGSTTLRGVRMAWGSIAATNYYHFHAIVTPTAGSHTYKVSAQRANAGSANVVATTTAPASITIIDLGPAS